MVAFRKLIKKLFGAGIHMDLQDKTARLTALNSTREAQSLTFCEQPSRLRKRRISKPNQSATKAPRRRLRRKLNTGMTFAAYKSNLFDRYTDLGVLTLGERTSLSDIELMAIINEWLVMDPSAPVIRKMAEEMAMGCWVEDRLS